MPIQRVFARLAAARVAAGTDAAVAASYLTETERIIGDTGMRAFLPEVWEIRASLEASLRAGVSRAECLSRAVELHREFGAPLQVQRIEALLG